jgi:hypothetical protein
LLGVQQEFPNGVVQLHYEVQRIQKYIMNEVG